MKKIPLLLACGCAAFLGAAVTPDYTASFDQDGNLTDAQGAVIVGKYSQPGAPELVDGKSGKALRTGTNADKTQGYFIVYPPEVLNPAAGTIALWVKPGDWDIHDGLYRVFFRAEGPKADLLIYKVPGHIVRFALGLTGEDGKRVWFQGSDNAGNWKTGEWHFVAVTWQEGKLTLHVDGRPPVVRDLKLLPAGFSRCGAGGLRPTKWQGGPAGATYIDELKIFKRALTPAEIQEVRLSK